MLNKIINQNLIEAHGIIGFYPCNSNEEDDIEIYEESNENKI
jgi:cobalamin-dependent methionine synthase I